MPLTKREVLQQLDGDYLLDYAIFTGAMRLYAMRTLEDAFKNDPEPQGDLRLLHRRFFFLNLYTYEYLAYEDLGAMLDGLLANRMDPNVPIVERLMLYKPGQVALSKIVEGFGIDSPTKLYEALGLGEIVPKDWDTEYKSLDICKALKTAASFFFTDCVQNQKPEGVRAFNKLKHGLLIVPSAQAYAKDMPNAPAALFETVKDHPAAAENPISLFAMPMDDGAIEHRIRVIHFVQCNLRMIAGLNVVTRFPGVAENRKKVAPIKLFREPYLADVLDFIEQVTAKG